MVERYLERIRQKIEEIKFLLEQADIPEDRLNEIGEQLHRMEAIVTQYEKIA